MNLNSVMRLTYLFGWICAALALIYRALEFSGMKAVHVLPATSRGLLVFGAFLFLATIATAAYAQAER